MSCITTFEMAILLNGNPTQFIKPSRGVRQGDPLSPYLFILAMEHLFTLIHNQVHLSNWTPIAITKQGPHISHTLFADDIFLFAEAIEENAHIILQVLDEFFYVSGLNMNANK